MSGHFFLVRWMYSNKSYAKNIEVLSYLLTDEQVVYMLSHPNEEIQQPTNKALSSKYVNVVLRIRNRIGGLAWGKLSWTISERGMGWSVVNVHEIPSPHDAKKYADIIIPVGKIIAMRNDSLPDPIIVKWDALYVYH